MALSRKSNTPLRKRQAGFDSPSRRGVIDYLCFLCLLWFPLPLGEIKLMHNPVLIVGSVAFDTIVTPFSTGKNILGGSASYACLACSFFTIPRLVSVVGNDFDPAYMERFRKRGVDLEGLRIDPTGKSFSWTGEYSEGFRSRETKDIRLNVFESFQPSLPAAYKKSRYVMLGNINPELQSYVLDQMEGDPFVLANTIDLWINLKRRLLLDLLKRVSLFLLNEEEVVQLTGVHGVIEAGWKLLQMGPKMAIVTKGKEGALLFHRDGLFTVPAYPTVELRDPTGAGDSFAGSFIGYLASIDRTDLESLKIALYYATATASLTVEAFSCDRLESAGKEAMERRASSIREGAPAAPIRNL